MTIDQVKELSFWLIVWVVASPAVAALATYAYMRFKYRAGIEYQRHLQRGLYEHL